MKEISIALWELTREEILRLPDGMATLIYNPMTSDYKIEYAGKKFLANDKHACSNLKYFTFEMPKLRTTVYYVKGISIGEEPHEEAYDVKIGAFFTPEEAHEEMYEMSEELTLAGQHIYSGLYIDSEEVYQ